MSYTPNTKDFLHSTNLISLYPKYSYLKSFLQIQQDINYKKTLNLFFDVKNILGLTFMEHIMAGLYNNTQLYNTIDFSILISFMNHIKRLKDFFYDYYENINFIYFMDNGESYYHKNLHVGYKQNRTITSNLSKEILNGFMEIYHTNLNITNKVMNKIKDTYFICLENLESDFIPYYVIRDNLINCDSLNITFSNDKDMYQNIRLNNSYSYVKNYFKKTDFILNEENTVNYYLKDNKVKEKIIDVLYYFDFLLSLSGDDGDGIDGIKGVGPKTSYKLIIHLLQENIFSDNYYEFIENIYNDEEHFKNKILSLEPKIKAIKSLQNNIDKVIRNIKLISYEYQYLYLKNSKNENDVKNKQIIESCLNINKSMSEDQYKQLMFKLKITPNIFTESTEMFKWS
jgi:hypothetical protein